MAHWRMAAMLASLVVVSLAQTADAATGNPSTNDWATTGWDCTLFAAADIDGDGRDDLITINGNRHLCVAFNVRGWKAAPWEVLAEDIATDAPFLFGADLLPAPGDEVVVVLADHVMVHGEYREGRLQGHQRIDMPAPATGRFDCASQAAVFTEVDGPRQWRLADGAFTSIDPHEATAAAASYTSLTITPPPFEPQAALLTSFCGD